MLLITALAGVGSGCDPESEPVAQTLAPPGERGALGKADAAGSCLGSDCAGQSAAGSCWCDEGCARYGDCCSDYAPVCAPDDSDGGEQTDAFVLADAPAASRSQLLALFGAGADETSLGLMSVVGRSRDACHPVTGCSAWYPDTQIDFRTAPVLSQGTWTSARRPAPDTATASLRILDSGGGHPLSVIFEGATDDEGGKLLLWCDGIDEPAPTPWVSCEARYTAADQACCSGSFVQFPATEDHVYMEWRGRIYQDGTVHFVSQDDQDVRHQLAITGQMPN